MVIVSFRSRSVLRDAVAPLAQELDFGVVVVDNASDDDSLEAVADLPITRCQLDDNRGFAAGCNRGWRLGAAPYVLFLNPDARVEPASVRRLINILELQPSIGIVAPLILSGDGEVEYSQRRFPRRASTFSQALFLHRLLPRRVWTDELVRDAEEYTRRRSVEWASGACLLVRRELLERLDGWDERFFLYCEDIDLCARAHQAGFDVVFEPQAVAVHAGGMSAPRAALLPVLAASRAAYARKHAPGPSAMLERIGIVLGSLTHAVGSRQGAGTRLGHLRAALRVALGR